MFCFETVDNEGFQSYIQDLFSAYNIRAFSCLGLLLEPSVHDLLVQIIFLEENVLTL